MNSLSVNTEQYSRSIEDCEYCDACEQELDEQPRGNVATISFGHNGNAECTYLFLCEKCFDRVAEAIRNVRKVCET